MNVMTKLQTIWSTMGLRRIVILAVVAGAVFYVLGKRREKMTLREKIVDRLSSHPSIVETITDRVTPHPSVKDRIAEVVDPVIHTVDNAVDDLAPRLTRAPGDAWDAIKGVVAPA